MSADRESDPTPWGSVPCWRVRRGRRVPGDRDQPDRTSSGGRLPSGIARRHGSMLDTRLGLQRSAARTSAEPALSAQDSRRDGTGAGQAGVPPPVTAIEPAAGDPPCDAIGCNDAAVWVMDQSSAPSCDDALCRRHYHETVARHPERRMCYLLLAAPGRPAEAEATGPDGGPMVMASDDS